MGAPANNIRFLADTIQPTDRNRVRVLLLGISLLMLCGLLAARSVGVIRARAPQTASAVGPSGVRLARLSDEISVHAAGRGNPWINLSDGRELITSYSGPAELTRVLEQNEARPLSLCSADFDEDGVPDLICGYAGPNGGILTVLRGNADSIYPNAPEAQQRRAEGRFTDAPFLSPAFVFGVPEPADFIGAGDFDCDGHWDVVVAAQGSDRLYLLSGDGRSGLRETKRIDLPGGVTAMVVGEINRRDGLDDVVVAVSRAQGRKVLVFEGPEGALRAGPETFDVPTEATSMALGQLDDEYEMDLAIAAGSELLIVHGRDRRLSLDSVRQKEVKPAAISRRTFPSQIRSIALGDFTASNQAGIALLLTDGSLHSVSRKKTEGEEVGTGAPLAEWEDEVNTADSQSWGGRLVSARMSSAPADSLLIVDSNTPRVHVFACDSDRRASDADAPSPSGPTMSLDVDGAPAVALPMRLGEDALSDLVILSSGHSSVRVAKTQPHAAFVVVNTNDSGNGSLRQAIIDANNSAGADTISFNIPGAGTRTINLQSGLPVVTGAVTIDGTTQPGFSGTPLIAIRRTGQGTTLQIGGGNSVVLALDICSTSNDDLEILTAGGNRIEGNVISEAGVTIRTSNNVIGGTTTAAGNRFADQVPQSIILLITGQSASGNQILGNSFLATLNSCAPPGLCTTAISLSAPNTIVGGTLPQARNVIFGSQFTTDIVVGVSPGTLIQGNFIGVDSSGTIASGSLDGISVSGTNVLIGGTAPSARNVISGHSGEGIAFLGDGSVDTFNLVQGNYIGTDSTGTLALGNRNGVVISLAKDTTIGGDTPGARNVISGNREDGAAIVPTLGRFGCSIFNIPNPPPNVDFPVLSNYIGTDASGTRPLGNGQNGLEVSVNAFSHEIRGNRIAFNGRSGIAIPESAIVALLPAFRIKIVDNEIFTNGVLGIDLADNGVTQNDLRDVDPGANLRQNFPLLESSSIPAVADGEDVSAAASLSVSGTFNSTPNSTFTLQFFFGSNCDGSGHQFIGAIPIPLGSPLAVKTDGDGNFPYNFSFEFPTGRNSGFVNSTATDTTGNTSESSECFAVTNPNVPKITAPVIREGKHLIVVGETFDSGAKIFVNGEQRKTVFGSSTRLKGKKLYKQLAAGQTVTIMVRNSDGTTSNEVSYTKPSG